MANMTPARHICRQCWRTLNPNITTSNQLRPFSSTTSRRKNGAVPSFTLPPTADPSLRELLDTIRNKIFLTSHLKLAQKRLIYRQKNWDMLRQEPITVDIDGEEFKLEPLDRIKDQPKFWATVLKVMNLLGSDAASWRGTFKPLLEGFRDAKPTHRWYLWQIQHMARRAGKAGMVEFFIEAAKVPDKTSLYLNDVRIVRQALWGCRELVVQQKAGPSKAFRQAEMVAQICDEKQHALAQSEAAQDPRVQPDCIGVLLELVSLSGVPYKQEKVKQLAERLLTNLEKGVGREMDAAEKELMENNRTAAAADYEVMRWLPVLRGLQLATELLGKEMPMAAQAKKHIEELEQNINGFKDTLTSSDDPKRDTRDGLMWLRAVEGS